MKLYEDFAKSRVKKSMDESLSEGERSSKVARTAKTKKETGTVCTHVFQVGIVYSLQCIVSVMRHHMSAVHLSDWSIQNRALRLLVFFAIASFLLCKTNLYY